MRLKQRVWASLVHPDLWCLMSEIEAEHVACTGKRAEFTSLRRRPGRRPSKHSPGPGKLVKGVDLRRRYLDAIGKAEEFCKRLQKKYGRYIGVVLEPEWLTPAQIRQRGGIAKIGPHIHAQLKSAPWPRVR